eukprot:scaffold26229_cov140-Isochrysis_galbana.AAC.3
MLAGTQGCRDGIGHNGDRQDQQHDVHRRVGKHSAHGGVPHQLSARQSFYASHALSGPRADGDQRAAAGGLKAEESRDVSPLRKPRAANETHANWLPQLDARHCSQLRS